MEELKKNKFLILIFVVILGVSILILYFNNNTNNNDYYEQESIEFKHYKENEYIPINITYDQMARIYLQDYVYKLLYNKEEAYNKLDENYRKAKFPTFKSFDSYVENYLFSLKLQEMKVSKYSVSDNETYREYEVYDSGDNLFIFKENGVMQYTVLFDRYIV